MTDLDCLRQGGRQSLPTVLLSFTLILDFPHDFWCLEDFVLSVQRTLPVVQTTPWPENLINIGAARLHLAGADECDRLYVFCLDSPSGIWFLARLKWLP